MTVSANRRHQALAEGRADEAEAVVKKALTTLDHSARTSLEARLWLAEHLAGRAAVARSDRASAREHFRHAAALAPGCWFGQGR